jgi:hypothetical protein
MMSTAEERNAEALAYLRASDDNMTSAARDSLRALLAPPPKRYTFGGVTFEETGEVRRPKRCEWALTPGAAGAYFWDYGGRVCDRVILRHAPSTEDG